MKAYLEIELFGDNVRQILKLWRNITNSAIPDLGNLTFGNMSSSEWVAEIVGFNQKYKYTRRFLKCKKDYSRANSKGSRGVFAEYILESGKIYDVKTRKSRYFCTVNENGDIKELTEREVGEWLKDHLESMSSQQPDKE